MTQYWVEKFWHGKLCRVGLRNSQQRDLYVKRGWKDVTDVRTLPPPAKEKTASVAKAGKEDAE